MTPQGRERIAGVRRLLLILGFVFGAYLIVRAVVEPFAIDMSDPATYSKDWGGPSLAGVLAVHCGPGIVAAVLMIWWLRQRRTRVGR
jgi:hypothetical protein